MRGNNPCFPVSRLVTVENTHAQRGGKVLPIEFLDDLAVLAQVWLSLSFSSSSLRSAICPPRALISILFQLPCGRGGTVVSAEYMGCSVFCHVVF